MKLSVPAAMLISLWAASSYALKPGDTLEQMKAEHGEPRSQLKIGDVTTYYYCGGTVEIQNGKVIHVSLTEMHHEDDIEKERAFAEEQKAKGLVLNDGKWTPAKKTTVLKNFDVATTPRPFHYTIPKGPAGE